MTEKIYKLQPNRTIALRGFDALGASAALHSATATSFQVSGIFRDAADFAVAVIWDADNFYEHPHLKYLPDFSFSGAVLTFDVEYSPALQPLDSPKSNWIDWATLDVVRVNDSVPPKPGVALWPHCMLQSGTFTAAAGRFDLVAGSAGPQAGDQLTLIYQNFAYNFVVPAQNSSVEYQFFAAGTGHAHTITVNDRSYTHTETNPAGEGSADQANALIALINAGAGDPQVTAAIGSVPYAVSLTIRPGQTSGVAVSATGNVATTIGPVSLSTVAQALAQQINGTDWWTATPLYALRATPGPTSITINAARYGTVSVAGTTVTWLPGSSTAEAGFTGIAAGSTLTIAGVAYIVATVTSPTSLTLTASAGTQSSAHYVADRGGIDGNIIVVYSVSKGNSLTTAQPSVQLSGGNSDVTWQCTLDFTALGIDQLRQAWFTFAPALANSTAYTAAEWQATFTNWTLADPNNVCRLSVAGPNSVRVEENSTACKYTGAWATGFPESGFFSGGLAIRAGSPTSISEETVTVTYSCTQPHDLYLGTSLYVDRATAVGVLVDAIPQPDLNCYLATQPQINTRRRLQAKIAPGTHTVKLFLKSTGYFYFDFIEAAVLTDIPPVPTARLNVSPALDYSTDHSYKLPPARILWIFDNLGFTGPVNQYIGVFWWNQRTNPTATFPAAIATFSGTWAPGDTAQLDISGISLGKTVFAGDSSSTIASHFAYYINELFVGIWAQATGARLAVTLRTPAYSFTFSQSASSAAGKLAVQYPSLTVIFYGIWAAGDTVHLTVNGTALSVTVALNDNPTTIASKFAAQVTQLLPGASPQLNAATLVIAANTPAYTFTTFSQSVVSALGTVIITGSLAGGQLGTWVVDPTQSPALNRGARDWHADLYAECKNRNREVVTSGSMELVNPPAGFAAVFPDGQAVITDVGFGNLHSTHCAQSSPMRAYQSAMFDCITDLQNAAGLVPNIQFGEYLWWFFTNYDAIKNPAGGMANFDAETAAAAQTALGRPLHRFLSPDDNPTVNNSADAIFLRNRLRDHVSALVTHIRSRYPAAQCEMLFADDVNYPTPANGVGGAFNSFINFPTEWASHTTAGFDRLKVEALSFGGNSRDLNLARSAIEFALQHDWPLASVRYLVPIFVQGCPWEKEVAIAFSMQIPIVNLWAFDQMCIFGLRTTAPRNQARSATFG